MKKYDVVVVGSGSGMTVVDGAVRQGKKVALIDKGPLGGTCLNVGCIPSKMLVYPADRVMEIREASKLDVDAAVQRIDFAGVMKRMREAVIPSREHMEQAMTDVSNLDYYDTQAEFIDTYTMEVAGTQFKGKQFFLASGARPLIPPIEGIEDIKYLTNENIFELTSLPNSIGIIGGGYIAAEFSHFFEAMGSEVTIMGRSSRMLAHEEPEISQLLQQELGKRMAIYTNTDVVAVNKQQGKIEMVGKNRKTDDEVSVDVDSVLVAAGRKSNADLLQVAKTGVETDKRGFIAVNGYLETSVKNMWAWGDAIGRYMFRHVANNEADVVWHNAHHSDKVKMDYSAIPYAVFSYPQIASVGMTEKSARKEHDILVGTARYGDVAKGQAMADDTSFAKAIVEKKSYKILGFHICGPYAPILIQEVVNAMALGGNLGYVAHGIHIHPALPELVVRTLGNLQEVN